MGAMISMLALWKVLRFLFGMAVFLTTLGCDGIYTPLP